MGFKRFDPEDLIISNDSVTATVFSNNNPTLTSFNTSSIQTAGNVGEFYYDVYQTGSTDTSAAVQFNIVYGDLKGSGSAYYNIGVPGASPTRTMYGQYRTLVLGDENASFVFGNQTSEYFYALNVERARYKEKLFPGTMALSLQGPGGTISLTDDSLIQSSVTYTDAGRKYNLVSGSAGTVYTGVNTSGWTAASGSYGWFLPDIGVLMLNGEALDGVFANGGIALNTTRSANVSSYNQDHMFAALENGSGWTLNSEETLSSDYIFVRARNNEFNYSENPSFISGSTGEVIFNTFIDSPITYITTVGMYNDNNELLAVAKLSRPLPKNFTKELLVRVKLDF